MKIEHIAMYVNDLEKAKEFFVKYFDAKSNNMYHNKNKNFKSYFLRFEDGARLEIMNKPDILNKRDQLESLGYTHLAISVGNKLKVKELTKLLEEDGYKVISGPRTTGDGYYESCIIGVEGNLIEITE